MAFAWVILFYYLDTYFYLHKRKSIQSIYKDIKVRITKQFLVKTVLRQLRQLSFGLFSGLVKEFWGQLKLKEKSQPYFIVEIFILGKNV